LTDAFSVFAGKMDTLDGDMNAFAHGRGKTQFSNMGFVFNPIVGATVPYSTLGAGFVFHPDDRPMIRLTRSGAGAHSAVRASRIQIRARSMRS